MTNIVKAVLLLFEEDHRNQNKNAKHTQRTCGFLKKTNLQTKARPEKIYFHNFFALKYISSNKAASQISVFSLLKLSISLANTFPSVKDKSQVFFE